MHTHRYEARSQRAAGDKAASFATGLSAWLGGVAFSVGVGHWAPMWLAAVLTALSVMLAASTSFALARRRRAG
jgi:Flp pilus assembly protein TadB